MCRRRETVAVIAANNGINWLASHFATGNHLNYTNVVRINLRHLDVQSDINATAFPLRPTLSPRNWMMLSRSRKNFLATVRRVTENRGFDLFVPHLLLPHAMLLSLMPNCSSVTITEEGLCSHIGNDAALRKRVATRLRLMFGCGIRNLTKTTCVGQWPATRGKSVSYLGVGETAFAWSDNREQVGLLELLKSAEEPNKVVFAMSSLSKVPMALQVQDIQTTSDALGGVPILVSIHPSAGPKERRQIISALSSNCSVVRGFAELELPARLAVGYGSSVLLYNAMLKSRSISLSPVSPKWPSDFRPCIAAREKLSVAIRDCYFAD